MPISLYCAAPLFSNRRRYPVINQTPRELLAYYLKQGFTTRPGKNGSHVQVVGKGLPRPLPIPMNERQVTLKVLMHHARTLGLGLGLLKRAVETNTSL